MLETLIDKLIALGIKIELAGKDNLKIHADIKKIPPAVLEEIKLHKPALIRYLADRSAANGYSEISTVEKQANYPLSSAQRRLWILSQFDDGNMAYNLPGSYVFNGELNEAALDHAFSSLLTRHESLRTVFREDGQGEPRQFILDEANTGFAVTKVDLRQEQEREEKVKTLIHGEFVRPFQLGTGPLIRAAVFRLEENKWIFTYVVHHIVSDGLSMSVLLRELLLFYNSFNTGNPDPLPALRIQYKDYAAWQWQQLTGAALEKYRQYWLRQFAGQPAVLDLPCEKIRPARKTYSGASYHYQMDALVSNNFKALCKQEGVTLFMGVMAAAKALFFRYTGQEDITLGTPVNGREHVDLEGQIGFYVSTLALRTQFSGGDSFRTLLANEKQVALGAFEHQVYPFDELVDQLKLERDVSRHPLFDIQVIVNTDEMGVSATAEETAELGISGYDESGGRHSVFDMVCQFTETNNGLSLDIAHNSDVYTTADVSRIAKHLEQLLKAIAGNADTPISMLEYLSVEEQDYLLNQLNDTAVDYPYHNLVSLVDDTTSKMPYAPAAVYADIQLSYAQLDSKANQLANYLLLECGVKKGDMVGVMLERSEKMIVCILGIMKCGAVYVPVDPDYPRSRKEYIFKDTGLRILITQTSQLFEVDFFDGHLFAADVQLDSLHTPAENPAVAIQPADIAYIIYTSGSTGEPKGVMISHAAAANSIQSQRDQLALLPGERYLQFSSASFDVSVFEIFTALSSGCILFIISEDARKNPLELENYIKDNSLDMAAIPPAYLRLLDMEKLSGLKRLLTGGEAATMEVIRSYALFGNCYNAYGPTEVSITATMFKLLKGAALNYRSFPIGKPIANTRIYILSREGALLPAGANGEICIAGAGLAAGYLNNPEMTALKFVPDPFHPGALMYKTGDTGRWLPDGNIEFTGRADEQVKIRGHRIEPGEIETRLRLYETIESAVVVVRENHAGEKDLAAYVTATEELNITALRNYLAGCLPAYMLPAYYVQLDELPLNINGKVDKKQLPDPEGLSLGSAVEYVAPQTEAEHTMAAIWQEVLGHGKVGIKDDYFELGGTSLKAMVIIKKVLDELRATLPIRILFELKTIESILRYLGDIKTADNNPVAGEELKEHSLVCDASWNQLIYTAEWNRKADHVVISEFHFTGIHLDMLKGVIKQLVERHEILRTVFIETGGVIKQQVLPADDFEPVIEEHAGLVSDEMAAEIKQHEYGRVFDLGKSPLFFIQLLRTQNGQSRLLVTLHHIITDGYSAGIMQQELEALMQAAMQSKKPTLAPLKYQYRDFSHWQLNFVGSEEGQQHKAYWLNKLNGFTPAVKMPWAEVETDTSGNVIALLKTTSSALDKKMETFLRQHSATPTAAFMGALLISLYKITGQADLTVLTTVSGRNSRCFGHLDVTAIIGFFSNMLLVRNQVNEADTIVSFIRSVQDGFLDDLHYDAYPAGKLIAEMPGINQQTFLNSTCIFNYHVYAHNQEVDYMQPESAQELIRGDTTMQAAFSLGVTEYKNCRLLQFIFNSRLFSKQQRAAFANLYMNVLNDLLTSPEMPVTAAAGKMLFPQLEEI